MARRHRRNHRRQKSNRNIWLYSGALGVIMAALGGAAYMSIGTQTPDQFGCYDAEQPPAVFALYDASTDHNAEQARSLRNAFDAAFENLLPNQRLIIASTAENEVADHVRPGFHICGAPRNPDELKALGGGSASAGYLQKQKQRLYEEVFAPKLEAMLSLDPASGLNQDHQSPLLETVQGISRLPEFVPGSTMIIASDLIQNSDSARFCREQGHMPRFAKFAGKDVYRRVQPRAMDGIRVQIWMIQQFGYGHQDILPYCSGEEEIASFWRDYFTHHGADEPELTRIRIGYAGS